ncbi:LysM peptidoglycan-binding domain-containing protein [Paraburkholderia phenazinium]|uniref:LysM domain-containing protein n=1 Tax=Paraburkholderia phenazinium TaxID=60549 RepID=A0A1G7W937_9BURK|nr:LysM peptidoglycan-binding domain-containing protein [Paraburkholderia phenazinium]SDG68452.1 LysM domain-containing protein [Paraburkholderia phenazinium]
MSAIDNLQQAVITAAGPAAFALDAAFLTAGLNDGSVTVPENYDKELCATFQVAAAIDFTVTVSSANVSPVANDSFTVTNAVVPFPGAAGLLQVPATLVFAVSGSSLVVQIASAPSAWTWTDSFPFMNGWPFNQLAPVKPLMVFSTADGVYPWSAQSSGLKVSGGAKLNVSASVPMPQSAVAVASLFSGLSVQVGQSLALSGVLDMSDYNASTVLLPTGTLTAQLQQGVFEIFYLKVANPSLMLTIPAPSESADDTSGQAPSFTVSALLSVGSTSVDQSPYLLQVMVSPSWLGGSNQYAIGLSATNNSAPLTPDSIVALVGGGGSYFTGVPSVLQQFLVNVGLQGLSLSGSISPATIDQVSVLIGSSPGMSWTPIPFAPPSLNFTITAFSLNWSMANPLSSQRAQTFQFRTTFTLAPGIFKGPDGVGDGVFEVEFDSGLNFSASFAGTASLSDFLSTLSGGLVSLPSSISASLANIALTVNGGGKSFNFTSEFNLSLSFLTVGNQPILSVSNGTVSIGASTPADSGSNAASVWQSSIGGQLSVGPFQTLVSLAYDGTVSPSLWTLSASLGQPLSVNDLIVQFFSAGGSYAFPDFLPGTLTIETFSVVAKIPSGSAGKTTYTVDVSFLWDFSLGDQTISNLDSTIGLAYDGSAFSGSVVSKWTYPAINLELDLSYQFEANGNKTLSLAWEGFTATYTSEDKQITFSLKGWTVGALLQALVRTLGNPYFTLDSPWDLLNQISLDGLQLNVSLENGQTNRLSASYQLSSPLNLGFITITKLNFLRSTEGNGKVTLEIEGSSPISDQLGDLMKPGGQDVTEMPPVPGRGSDYFKVFLLVLGQRIGITGSDKFDSTQSVINALAKVPSTNSDTNPVNPNPSGQPDGFPYYNQDNNWLIAGHLGFLQVEGSWTVDAMFVFNDPNLYGLRLALAGPKAGGLANLAIDILYKKITDDIGLFQVDFSFPDAIRKLNLGAVSVTLPQISVQVYTNGDFLIDIGFPYNNDFSRSFALYAIIAGVPVVGGGGFYFGKLSAATATQVPVTTNGTFDPVVVFGIGLQLGLGYSFSAGPLSASFSLTVFGIVEGVIAAWHPYSSSSGTSLTTQSSGALQDQYYFKLTGTIGIIGTLAGKVDFVIIQASVSVNIVLSVQMTYESYREIPITASAYVSVKVTIKIDLGLFSIKISFSFSMTVTASFTIGQNQSAPWDSPGSNAVRSLLFTARSLRAQRVAALAAAVQPRPKRVLREADAKPTLNVLMAPQFTVLAPEGATAYSQQQGAFVFLLAMDASIPGGDGTGDTSFDQLCASFFPWLIDTLSGTNGAAVDLAGVSAQVVSAEQLEAWINALANNANPPLDIASILGFLDSAFFLNFETADYASSSGDKTKFQAGSTIFPVFDGLSLTVPKPDGSGTDPIDFGSYTTVNDAYRAAVADEFAEVETSIEQENNIGSPPANSLTVADDSVESMAALIFVDYFTMIGRQLLQTAQNLLASYAWPLQSTDSIASILAAVNAISPNELDVDDIASPNQNHALSAAKILTTPPLAYTVQSADTLTGIAARFSDGTDKPARWQTTVSSLITANWTARIIQPGVAIDSYTTVAGDSFESIGKALGMNADQLAQVPAIASSTKLLTPAAPMSVAPIAYTSADGDTLASVATLFATTVPLLATASQTVGGLFSVSAEGGLLTLANLQAWTVSDLWTAIADTDQVAQTAGMVSRFLMFGLSLPASDGLTLSDQFLFPTGQSAYGLYQLTGQEFPTPAPAAVTGYAVTVSAATASHGVDLNFVQFDGVASRSAALDLLDSYNNLCTVLSWAQAGNFKPAPGFSAVAPVLLQPKAVATGNYAYWVTSDMAALQTITTRTGGTATSQTQATLWPLPSSVLALTATRQASLDSLFGSLSAELPLLPQFQPQRGQTSPASSQTDYTDLQNWAWATRINFSIKRLPVSGVSSGGSDDTPNGPANAASLPNVYEITGTATADAQTLEQLLSAIDSMSVSMLSGLFVCYEQQTQPPALATLGTQEFLTFIAQTNLSTETNPELAVRGALALGADIPPPRGIGNPPAEFIKLLWEQSTVRSGGYYLFYQVVSDGTGLPADIFDANGNATLSMIATFTATGSTNFGYALPCFVNAFVTTDGINVASDVVQVASLSTSGQSAAVGAQGASLADVASLYGATPARIAADNQTLALTSGAVIPVNGLTHQLTEADLADPAQTLANLAAYYSQGAVTTITGPQIATYNPGVAVALGSVFYIPSVSYKVAAASAPGDSFASMAAYYGISIDAMAVLALPVAGLLRAGAVLTIDTQSFDLRNQLPAGNVSFSLNRVDMGPPPDQSSDPDYAATFMYSLYNTLSAGVQANAFFKASAMGLPFGPQDNEPSDVPSAFASHAEIKQRRRMKLNSAAQAEFIYSQSLGFSKVSTLNPAPAAPADGLPPASANPYVGVGTPCQIALQWQDLFGNTTVTPFTVPPAGYSGALNGSAINLLYTDLLIGLSSWSNTTVNYLYAGTAGQPVLNVNLAFATVLYATSPDEAVKDLALYQKIYFQLNQNYKDLGVPDLSGNAVSMSLSNSLLATPESVLSDTQADQVRSYVSACVQCLQGIVNGGALPDKGPSALLAVPVTLASVASGDIIALDVTLTLSRAAVLVDPQVAAGAGGLAAQSVILPQPDPDTVSGGQPAFLTFSRNFEAAFQNADWQMRIGEGLKASDSNAGSSGTMQLWAVRFGASKGNGIYFNIAQNAPSYYTAAPVATSLVSRTASITEYSSGNAVTLSFTGVDQNQWFQTCLDAIDAFLSASDSTSAFILDQLLGKSDPLIDGYLGAVLEAKDSLATSIAGTVKPILSTSASDASTYEAAKNKLYQQLLNQIGSAYAASAVVLYQVSDASGAGQPDAAGPPDLYGQPQGVIAGNASVNQNFTLSAARIPLGPVTTDGVPADPRLSFFFSTKNTDDEAYVPLTLNFAITHLEFNKATVAGIDGYIDSEWLVFVTGPYIYGLNPVQAANIPVVNRNLPTPPTVQNQLASQSTSVPVVPVDLTGWDYSFVYTYPFAAQDSVQTTMQLNVPNAATRLMAPAAGPDLFTALAQFVTSYPAIAEDFRTYLTKIDADTTDQTVIEAAAHAVQCFAEYLANVATAYAGQLSQARFAAAQAPELIELDFETVLTRNGSGNAVTNLLNVTINGTNASWDQANATISAGGITLPAPVVQILPDSYTPVPTAPTDGLSLLTYLYQETASPTHYLSWDDAEIVQERTVVLPGLDVLLHQNGQSSIRIERNKTLFPLDTSGVSTNPAFIFTTPSVSFSGAAVPRLVHQDFSLENAGNASASLEALLTEFFAGLFEGGNGAVSVEASVTGSFTYPLTGNFPVSLPVCLLPPVLTVVEPAVTPAFVSVLAETVEDWLATQKPNLANGAENSFKLTLFGAGDQQPLLVVNNLYQAIPAG